MRQLHRRERQPSPLDGDVGDPSVRQRRSTGSHHPTAATALRSKGRGPRGGRPRRRRGRVEGDVVRRGGRGVDVGFRVRANVDARRQGVTSRIVHPLVFVASGGSSMSSSVSTPPTDVGSSASSGTKGLYARRNARRPIDFSVATSFGSSTTRPPSSGTSIALNRGTRRGSSTPRTRTLRARVANQDGALGVLERDRRAARRRATAPSVAASVNARIWPRHAASASASSTAPSARAHSRYTSASAMMRSCSHARSRAPPRESPESVEAPRRRLVREHRPRVARIRARTARGEPVPLVRLALGAAQMRELLRVRGVDEGGRLGLRRELRVRRGHSRRLLRLEHRILRGDLLPLDLFQAKALRLGGGGRLLRGQPGGLLLRLLRRLLVLLRLRGKAWTGTSGVRASSSREKRTTRETRKRGGGGDGRGTDDASGDGRDAPPSRAGGENPSGAPSETRVPNRAARGGVTKAHGPRGRRRPKAETSWKPAGQRARRPRPTRRRS